MKPNEFKASVEKELDLEAIALKLIKGEYSMDSASITRTFGIGIEETEAEIYVGNNTWITIKKGF